MTMNSRINKLRKASVEAVNTLIMPAKQKTRMTRSGQLSGRVSSYKKAVVTLPEGEEIDFFGDI